ncbi:WD40-repeat-containing domain protein, partial [Mycena capillaripes]
MGGNGGVGGEQGGGGGTGEGPRMNYGSIQTPQFIVNNHGNAQMNFQERGNTREILANLTSVAAHYNAINTPEKCMEGTRVNIIRDLVACLTCIPEIRLVMLSGVAGSGKSTIAKTVATILDEEKTLAASFFFSRDHTDRKEINHLATTLAMQLADYSPDFRAHLIKLLEEDTRICRIEPHLQFQKLVVEILGKLPPCSKPWVICLDALDECGKDRGQIVLRWLSDSMVQIPAHIRFFLTGRPDVPSYLKFDKLLSQMHSVVLDQIEPLIVQQDIHLYVKQSLDGANWITRHPWKIKSQQAEEITTRANELFVFAATAVRYVLAGLPQTRPQKSVDYLLGGEPLTDLDHLYLRIVNDAILLAALGDQRAQDSHNQAMRILSTILHLREPLDSQSLADLLELEKSDLLGALLPLSAVIHVSDTPGAAIKIIHLSFREFMTSRVQGTRCEILCGTENQLRDLVSALMKVLDRELRFNICDLPTSYLRNKDMPDFQWRLNSYIPLHLRYAAEFWIDHLVETTYDSFSAQGVQSLLFKKFLFWLEVLSLLGIVSYGQETLTKLIGWAKESKPLLEFLSDAKRFVSFFGEAINQSAPHIYLSALALAPAESKITEIFLHDFPNLVSITKGRMKQWPNTIAILEGHTNLVTSVAFSPDGKRIVSGSYDSTVRIWDAETGAALREPLQGHTGPVTSVAFSPDGKRIVSGSYDSTVRIWDAETGAALREPLEGHTKWVTSVAFSPDGKRIVSGSSDSTVRIWDAETGAALREPLEGHTDRVTSVAFSPDGKRIVSGSYDSTVRIWDAETGAALREPLEGHTDSVTSVAFSPDGKRIVSGSDDSTVRIWDAETGAALREPLEGHTNSVMSVAFSPDGKRIVSGSYDSTVRIWDAETGAALREPLEGHTDSVISVAFSPDGKRIVSGSDDSTVCIWDSETG